jgi:hypothetical protein
MCRKTVGIWGSFRLVSCECAISVITLPHKVQIGRSISFKRYGDQFQIEKDKKFQHRPTSYTWLNAEHISEQNK